MGEYWLIYILLGSNIKLKEFGYIKLAPKVAICFVHNHFVQGRGKSPAISSLLLIDIKSTTTLSLEVIIFPTSTHIQYIDQILPIPWL